MTEHGLPVLYALFVWWFSTGLIAWLNGLDRSTFRWTLLGASIVGAAGLGAVAWAAGQDSVAGAYAAFTGALAVWAWNETAFLLGAVTGPHRTACPPGVQGWERTGFALRAILWHELAILAGGLLILLAGWDAPNQVAGWTYLLLWGMRISAKLNVFLGVPNLSEAFLPGHMGYLASFFRRRPMNVLFPVSVTGATLVTWLLAQGAADPSAGPMLATGLTLLAAMAALALVEHWLMVLPLPSAALWAWYLGQRLDRPPPSPQAGPGPNLAPSTPWRPS